MMKALGLVLIVIAVILPSATILGEPCDKIEDREWHVPIRSRKTCFMSSAVITSADFLITSDRDETVEGFYAYANKKFEYLPTNLDEKFPNLIAIKVLGCSIKKISKNNFKDLSKLRWLYLQGNLIEKIDDDTFDGISAVVEIQLNWNNIRKLNSRAFTSLNKLALVGLYWNYCIGELFYNATRLAEMPRIVDAKCGFKEDDLKAQPDEGETTAQL